jgi:hypothetical protein
MAARNSLRSTRGSYLYVSLGIPSVPTLLPVMSARTHASSVAWSTEILNPVSGAERIAWMSNSGRGQGGSGLSLAASCTELQVKQKYRAAQLGLPQASFSAATVIG